MPINTKYRSEAPEIMDDFSMKGEILRDALDKIASINQLLGGNSVTLQGVKILLKNHDPKKEFRIVDIGCGNGDMLRTLADYAKKHQLNFKLTGIDANEFTISHARTLSANYANISYECFDIFGGQEMGQYDILLCTLTLHHFKDREIVDLLTDFKPKVRIGFVVNDLHRSALAYRLFQGICYVFKLNDMSREDGLISILRGFKRKDLKKYSAQLNLKNYSIRWKWAFRYQWIVGTT